MPKNADTAAAGRRAHHGRSSAGATVGKLGGFVEHAGYPGGPRKPMKGGKRPWTAPVRQAGEDEQELAPAGVARIIAGAKGCAGHGEEVSGGGGGG